MNPHATLPVLIVGQGLAGTAVAWKLWEHGVPFLIVDPNEANTCSKVAAGLVTPITGKRLKLSWRIEELLPVALSFYQKIEKHLGIKFYHPLPQARLFKNPREAEVWQSRLQETEVAPWIEHTAPDPLVDPALFRNPFGGFQQKQSAWMDTATYLEASRAFFEQHECWQQGRVDETALEPSPDAVQWQGESYAHAVLCRGWQEQQQATQFFPWLKFDSALGVIFSIKAALPEHRIISGTTWMLPRGHDQWKVGSTYEFELFQPIDQSVERLKGKLHDLLRVPYEITEINSGIRPILKQRQLAIGRHPTNPRIAFFNGLGSKGVLRAPFFAQMLVDHWLQGTPIDETVDVLANHN